MESIFSRSKEPVLFRTSRIECRHPAEHDVFHRHRLLQGFDQGALAAARVAVVGAGSLGSEIAMALVRKGVGEISIFDGDLVELSNLSRQHYVREDLYRSKAACLAKNLVPLAVGDTVIRGIPMPIQEAVDSGCAGRFEIAVVGVDNYPARAFCCGRFQGIPVVFTAVSPDADSGFVFVQEPGKACLACFCGDQFKRPARRCSGASVDIAKVMGGIVSYAVDTLLMARARAWNYMRIDLTGRFKNISETVEKDPACIVCSEEK